MASRLGISTLLLAGGILLAGCGAHTRRVVQIPMGTRITAADLATVPDEQLTAVVVGQVILAVGDDFAHRAQIIASLPAGTRAVYATHQLEEEMAHGGFHQYFWNTDGVNADLARRGYALLGAKRHARVVEEATCVFLRERERRQRFRQQGTSEAFAQAYRVSKLGPLDERFFALEPGEDPAALRIRYIRAHPTDCIP